MSETRFHNQLGDEYELFKIASPYYDDLQNSVGFQINKIFKDSDRKEINVLEIGFGAGATSAIILNSDQRVRLVAVDNEPLMLPKITQKLSGIDQSRYELHLEDALVFLNECSGRTFDAVVSAWVIHNFTAAYRLKVLGEIYRILKAEGVFINADKIEITDRIEHEKNLAWQLAHFDVFERMGRPELKREWTEHYLEDSRPGRALIENEFEEEIKFLGFSSFEIPQRWHDDAIVLIKKS